MHGKWTGFAANGIAGLLALGLGVALSRGAWLWAFAAGAAWAAISITGLSFGFVSGLRRPVETSPEKRSPESSDLPIFESDMRALLDSVPTLICVIDAEARFEYANRAQQDQHGRPAHSFVGVSILDTIGESAFAIVEPYIRRALRGERVRFEVEFPNPEAGGHPLYFDSVYVPRFDSDGSVSGFYSFSVDITGQKTVEAERRALEQRMMQSENLESLGMLARGVAHDFNNLLVSIMANVDIVRFDLNNGGAVDEELRQIEIAAQNAAVLCRQMLDYSGQADTELELVDLSSLAKELSDVLDNTLPASVSLRFDPEASMAPVQGNPGQLRQVIMSLIKNAWEAMPEGEGSITISSGVVYADTETLAGSYIDDELLPGQYAFLQVSDTGSGMNEEVMSNLFDPFYSTKFTGRDLGLAAVLGIVRGHRGAIEVESKLEVGTQIRILIPVLEAQARPKPPDEFDAIDEWRGSGTVLVVDDDPGLRRATHRILTGCGLQPLTAEGGNEALEIIKQLPPGSLNLIVLDLTMPGMDGAETLAKIRRIDAEVPVLLCSGHTEAEVKKRCKGLHYSGMLAKPFGFKSFASAIRALLEP